MAVQWGNYDAKVPATGNVISIAELHAFARDDLHVDYVFWGTQEPYCSKEVVPYLRTLTVPKRDRK